MEAAGALVTESSSQLDGVATLDRDRFATALREPDDAPFEHIDRRQDFELLC